MPAAAAVQGALPWHAGGAWADAGTAAETGEWLSAPAAKGSRGAEGVGLGAPHPTRIPHVFLTSPPLSPPSAPVGGGPASSLSSSLVAARPDIIPCAVMTMRGLLLPASQCCRGLYRGAPPGNIPVATARWDQSVACTSHGDRCSRTVVGAAQHRSCFPPWGPGITSVLPPLWQRQAAPVPAAWGNRGREQ